MWRRLLVLIGVVVGVTAVVVRLFIWTAAAGGGAPVVIEAVLYQGYLPGGSTGQRDEAVRLLNVAGTAVDVGGWQLTDGVSMLALPVSTTLQVGEAIWLAKEGQGFYESFGFWPDWEVSDSSPAVPNASGSWPGFADAGDEVMLRNGVAEVVDCLVYEAGSTAVCPGQWVGAALEPFTPSTTFAEQGQILYRRRDQGSGLPVADTNTAADWAQGVDDVVNGRKVHYPGWDLDLFFQTAALTETAVLTVAIAPDNAYEAIVQQIETAEHAIHIEALTFENLGIAEALIAALGRGVDVTVLLEGSPVGGIPDQENYICRQLALAGGACWFMINEPDLNIYDRYRTLHAKFILIDGQRVLISSENLSPNSLPYDDKSDGTWGRRGVVLMTDASTVVQQVETIFAQDFDPEHHRDITDTGYLPPLPPGYVPITETGGVTYTVRFAQPMAFTGDFFWEVVQSPENSLRNTDALLGLVGQTAVGDQVLVQMLYEHAYWGASTSNAVENPNPRLEAYVQAARRGARVRLLLDGFFDDPEDTRNNVMTCDYVNVIAETEALDLACRQANPAGLGIHNKMVLVQLNGRGYVHVGSINGSEVSSKGNREVALQVQSDGAFALLAELFAQDWGHELYLPVMLHNYIAPATHLLITELLYDPAGPDDTEFVEIANPTRTAVDLSGFSIGDAVNPTDFEDVRRFPPGTLLQPGQSLVVATAATAFFTEYGRNPDFEIVSTDTAVPDLLDDPAWGDPEALLQLANGGDELLLRDAQDQVVDVVVYGSGVYGGMTGCTLVVSANASLERFPYWRDTDDCTADFREWPFPNPGILP